MDWITSVPGLLSSGCVIYLIVEKLFTRKKDNAEAHGTEVASFDAEVKAIREIKLDMLEDIKKQRDELQQQREEAKGELQKSKDSISGTVANLQSQVEKLSEMILIMQRNQSKAEELHAQQMLQHGKTIQNQAEQINKMTMYWQLLCDKDCSQRHVPICPLKTNEDATE